MYEYTLYSAMKCCSNLLSAAASGSGFGFAAHTYADAYSTISTHKHTKRNLEFGRRVE